MGGVVVSSTTHVPGWATYGEVMAIDASLRKHFGLGEMALLRLVPPGMAKRQTLSRTDVREATSSVALREARRLRDAMAAAAATVRVRGNALRVALELTPSARRSA